MSGVFIPIDLIGGAFKKAAEILPFYHSVHAIRAILDGQLSAMIPHLIIVLGYTVVVFTLAMIAFQRKMSGGEFVASGSKV
jgi:ABC-2 type transport system permease protein